MKKQLRRSSIEARAINYAVYLIEHGATDWQEIQNSLANHGEISKWLKGDEATSMRIIRKAEAKFGGNLPAGYSD